MNKGKKPVRKQDKKQDKKQVRRRVKKTPDSASRSKKEPQKYETGNKKLETGNKKYETNNKKLKLILRIVILVLEIVVFAALVYGFIFFNTRLKNQDYSEASLFDNPFTTEKKQLDPTDPGNVSVDNDKFALSVSKVQLTDDTDGNPAAYIFFSFTNKTETLLSMSEVFPPSVKQNGVHCDTFASILEPPEEFYNKDKQIANGETVQVCYTIELQDKTSDIELTIHDNYTTFEDVGTVVIKLQQ